jgi:hypothetical protein
MAFGFLDYINVVIKKSLKIPKGNQKTSITRMTDNTMVKGKRTKKQTMIYKSLLRKLKIVEPIVLLLLQTD